MDKPVTAVLATRRRGGARCPQMKRPAFPFDLEGMLVEGVYRHVLAWQGALDRLGIELAASTSSNGQVRFGSTQILRIS